MYENKSKQELIELLQEKDILISKFKSRKEPGRKKYEDVTTIKLMYDLYLSNASLQNIADFLNENKIKSPTGGLWRKTSIKSILNHNENLKKFLDQEMYENFLERKEKNKRNSIKV